MKTKRRDSGAWIAAALVFIVCISAVLAGGVYYYQATVQTVEIANDGTLCPSRGPESVTEVLFDISDPLPETAQLQAESYFWEKMESMPKHGLLEIRVLRAEKPYQETFFSKCNPGDGSDLSPWDANPDLAKRNWLLSFAGPAKEAVRRGLFPSTEKHSPIMAALQRIALERFIAGPMAKARKEIVIVSDLIESTESYSQFKDPINYDFFRNSPAYLAFKTDMNDAEVTILYVLRKTARPIDRVNHIRFWQEWVHDNNAKWKSATTLQGINPINRGAK